MPTIHHAHTFRAAAAVAGADGTIDPRERRVLEKLGRRIGVGPRTLDAISRRAAADPPFCRQQLEGLRSNPDLALKTLFTVAVADGSLQDDELQTLRHLADALGVPPSRFAQIRRAAETFLQTRAG